MKKVTLGTIGKSLDCLVKNTCKEIDLSTIEKSLQSLEDKISNEETAYQPFHEMLTAEKTYTDSLFSLTFKVKEGTADVNVNGTTIEYEEGDIITWDGKISPQTLKGSIIITPKADSKVLVIGIKKV